MRLRGLLVGTAAAALLFGSAGYGVALARGDADDRGTRGSRPATMQHGMMAMHRQMGSAEGQMMREAGMREMDRRMMRDPQMREMHEAMDHSDAGSMRGHDMRDG